MKCLHFVAFTSASLVGVVKKLDSQARAFAEAWPGSRALFVLDDSRPTNDLVSSAAEVVSVATRRRPAYRVRIDKFSLALRRLLGTVRFGDAVYLRYPLADPCLLAFVFVLRLCGTRIFTEHNDKECGLHMLREHTSKYVLELLFKPLVNLFVSGFIAVTSEILAHERRFALFVRKRTIVSGNGIDASSIPAARTIVASNPEQVRLIFVGSPFLTHGLDRLIRAMRHDRRFALTVVGGSAESEQFERSVREYGLSDRVVFVGTKTGRALDDEFSRVDLAVGSLAIHRKRIYQTSELKAREYCARGIPFFCSEPDPDLPPDLFWRLQVERGESPISTERLYKFHRAIHDGENVSEAIRQYAIENLDWRVKMARVVRFMRGEFVDG